MLYSERNSSIANRRGEVKMTKDKKVSQNATEETKSI